MNKSLALQIPIEVKNPQTQILPYPCLHMPHHAPDMNEK